MVEFFRSAYAESEYLLYEPDEYEATSDQARQQWVTGTLQRGNVMFICEQDARVIGVVIGLRSNFRRTRHNLFLILGVLGQWHRQGLGHRLMSELVSWAGAEGIRRLELVADVRNAPAIALYKKVGFEIEGTRREARLIGERLIDEYWMSKLLT